MRGVKWLFVGRDGLRHGWRFLIFAVAIFLAVKFLEQPAIAFLTAKLHIAPNALSAPSIIESAANNNGRRAQRVWSDMELCREECDRGLFQELDCKKNCGCENKKPPTVAESIPTDEQPFDSSHAGLHEFLFA